MIRNEMFGLALEHKKNKKGTHPASHAEHAVAPVPTAIEPCVHFKQTACAATLMYEPTAHDVHTVAPTESDSCVAVEPAGQL